MIGSSGRWRSYPQNWQHRRKGMFHSIHHFLCGKKSKGIFIIYSCIIFVNVAFKQYLRNGIWMTRNATAIGMENSIDIIQMKVIINFEIYLGGRALQRNECKEGIFNVYRNKQTCNHFFLALFFFNLAHRLFHKLQRTHWTIGSIY